MKTTKGELRIIAKKYAREQDQALKELLEANYRLRTQHTPGPWKHHLGRGETPRFHIQTTGGYQIASTTELVGHSQAYEENAMREANARLIAAAPELLKALKEVRNMLEGDGEVVPSLVTDAITKAEGK